MFRFRSCSRTPGPDCQLEVANFGNLTASAKAQQIGNRRLYLFERSNPREVFPHIDVEHDVQRRIPHRLREMSCAEIQLQENSERAQTALDGALADGLSHPSGDARQASGMEIAGRRSRAFCCGHK